MSTLKDSLDIIKRHWNDAPVPVQTIAVELGLPVQFISLPDNISGAIKMDGPGYKIVVNAQHANTRQRFTIAHEIGHFLYHRDLLGKGVGDDRAYRSEDTTLPNPNITATHERQANTFAANLLMPKALLEKLVKQGITSTVDLAKALQVSEEALKIRLGRATREFVREPGENDVEVIRPGQQ